MYEQIAKWLYEADTVAALTGAGISTESGIPDFRSPGGIWSRARPIYYEAFLHSAEARYEYWRQKAVAERDFSSSVPNAGHRTLARWERQGRLAAVITQNIDGLHQQAGSQQVLELHGSARQVGCLSCPENFDAAMMVAEFLATDTVPTCPHCDGLLKHNTVSFGQSLPDDVLKRAYLLSRHAELFFVIGSSLVVEPAGSLPRVAYQAGARLVFINRKATPLDNLAVQRLHTSAGAALAAIDSLLPQP